MEVEDKYEEKVYTVFETPTSDLSHVPAYERSWDFPTYIRLYKDYDVEIPDAPPEKNMVNYGLKLDDQVFRKTEIPKDLRSWPLDKKEHFIEREYQRRTHGLWYIIKGKPIYIPGTMYFFMNYWILETGWTPVFKMPDLDFFLIWMHVVRSPKIYGLVDFKCRRIGDTEKALCIMYEYASRVKNTLNAMQDGRTNDDIFATYQRLTFAHQSMIWFMKPINRGTTNPKASLEFKIPEKKTSAKSYVDQAGNLFGFDETEFEFEAVGSTITYYPSKPEAGDGKRHGRYYFDEFGKMKMLDALEAWKFVKKSMVDDTYKVMAGKALFTSTIEEMKDGKALRVSQKLWDKSDTNKVNKQGYTSTGLIRIVRGSLEKGNLDRWGYVDKEARLKEIEEERKYLIEQKDWSGLITHQRQECIDEKDVFTNVSDGSNFNVENLTKRQYVLEYEKDPKPWVQGNFEWLDGVKPLPGNPNKRNKRCRVIWVPCENGRFAVSGHPSDWGLKDNAMSPYAEVPRPNNIHAFCCGIDPVAQKDVVDLDDMSLSALAIKRKLDPTIDQENMYDEKGNPLDGGENFKTNRYVCAYLYRHMEPTDNYDDWLKAMVYYGTDFLIEKNKSEGFRQWLDSLQFDLYHMDNSNGIKNTKGQIEVGGLSASEKVIEYYFSLLTTISNVWANTIDIPIICDQLKSTKMGNQGKRDLSVACGFCEIAAQRDTPNPIDEDEEEYQEFFEERVV